jgi:thiol-disulfide isomerase/thioredoxin
MPSPHLRLVLPTRTHDGHPHTHADGRVHTCTHRYRQLFDLLKQETRSSVASNVWQILTSLCDSGSTRLLPKPVCEVDTTQRFEAKMREIAQEGLRSAPGSSSSSSYSLLAGGGGAEEPGLLAVVTFTAKWCPPCATLAPAMRIFALKVPTVRFVAVDVDDCDGLAQRYMLCRLLACCVLSQLVRYGGSQSVTNPWTACMRGA